MEWTQTAQGREKDLGSLIASLLIRLQRVHVGQSFSSDILLLVHSLIWWVSYPQGPEVRGSLLPAPRVWLFLPSEAKFGILPGPEVGTILCALAQPCYHLSPTY